ncbi:MAG: TolB family protein [Gemmatimonadales bacterium]
MATPRVRLIVLLIFGAITNVTFGVSQGPPGTDIYLVKTNHNGKLISFGTPFNITDRDGYDNQPSFTPDGAAVLYTSNRGGQTDIYRYDIAARSSSQVTRTDPESEYSPTVTPGGDAFSVIEVEADSTQRLWRFALDGTRMNVVLADVKPVGYHAWGDNHTLALFVLGRPSTLQLADTQTGQTRIVAYNIGRSLHNIPGRHAISFTHRIPEFWIKELDLDTQAVRPLVPLLEGNEFYAWTPSGIAIMGHGSKLFSWDPASGNGWKEVADFGPAGLRGISRLAMSATGDWLAVVATR